MDDITILAVIAVGAYVVVKLVPNISKAIDAVKTDAGLGSGQATYDAAVKARKDIITSKIPSDTTAGFIYEGDTSYRISPSSLYSMSANQRREFLNGASMKTITMEGVVVNTLNNIISDPFGLQKLWSVLS